MNKMKTLVAFAALMLCGGAWAAAPVAVWENLNVSGDALTQNGMTLNLNLGEGDNSNKIVNNTAVQIGDKPIVVTLGTNGFTDYIGTVIVKYSGISANPSSAASLVTFNDDYTGLWVDTTGAIKGIWTKQKWTTTSSNGNIKADGQSHYLTFGVEMTKNAVKRRGTHAYIDGNIVYNQAGLVGSNTAITKFNIGGYCMGTDLPVYSGLVVEKIAVFHDILTPQEAACYVFESDATQVATVNGDTITWGTAGEPTDWANAKVFVKGTGHATLNLTTAPAAICAYDEAYVDLVFDCTASNLPADNNLKNIIVGGGDKIRTIFNGSGAHGATIDFGNSNVDVSITSHVVFSGGTHTWTSVSNNSILKFGVNATQDNPTIRATGNATVTMNVKDPCGWSAGNANISGIIRVDDGSVLNFNYKSGTMYWNQQFYIEPGATFNFNDTNSDYKFRLGGGANKSACVIYVPDSDTSSTKVAKFVQTGTYGFQVTGSTVGMGIYVGRNSKLEISAEVKNSNQITKYGDGQLVFTKSCNTAMKVSEGFIEKSGDGQFANLTIDSGASIVFPEGTEEGSAYALCTGTLSATSTTSDVAFYVGSLRCVGALTYNTTEKTVSYAKTAYFQVAEGETCSSLEEVALAYPTDSVTVNLLKNCSVGINIPANVTVDTNGHNLTGTISGSGLLKASSIPSISVGSDWTGVVELAAIDYGSTKMGYNISGLVRDGSTLKLHGIVGNDLYFTNTTKVNGTVELVDGAVLKFNNGTSGWKLAFGEITGTGTLRTTIDAPSGSPSGITVTIDKLSSKNVTLTSNNNALITVSNLVVAEAYGTPLIPLSNCSAVTVSKVNGVAKETMQESDGIYLVAAKIGDAKYKTVQAAINEVGEGDVTTISIVGNPVIPDGYCVVDGHLVYAAAATVKDRAIVYYPTLQMAVDNNPTGGTVSLLASLYINESVTIPSTFNGSLEFNGCHLIGQADVDYVLDIENGATIYLNNSDTEYVASIQKATSATYAVRNKGSMIVHSLNAIIGKIAAIGGGTCITQFNSNPGYTWSEQYPFDIEIDTTSTDVSSTPYVNIPTDQLSLFSVNSYKLKELSQTDLRLCEITSATLSAEYTQYKITLIDQVAPVTISATNASVDSPTNAIDVDGNKYAKIASPITFTVSAGDGFVVSDVMYQVGSGDFQDIPVVSGVFTISGLVDSTSINIRVRTVAAVARFEGVEFATIEEAIRAAGVANLDQITIIDPTAEVPTGYRVKGGKVMTAAKYYEHWKVNPGVLSWVTGAANLASNNAKLKVFHITDGTDGETEYSGATAAAGLPGYNNNVTPWHLFVKKNTYASIAPGYVLRFPGNGTVTDKAVSGDFEPFNVGGVIVEPGAVGYSFTHDGGSRSTDLGDPDNTQETWLYFAESFKIHRSGNTTLHGPINIEVAEDKVFDINSAMNRTLTLTGKLAFHGEGTIKVRTLNASNATLDLRKVGSETTAFITGDSGFGNVTVNAETKIYFPENWAAGTPMKLCSGAISGSASTDALDVKIGEKTERVILSYDSENGTVSYGYAPTAQTWTNGTIIFDGDLHHLTPNQDGTYTKTIGDVTYTINLNGHELKTEDGKSYILIKEDANNSGLGVIVSRASATGNTGAMVAMRYSDYPAYDSTHPIRVAMTIQGNAGSPYNNTAVGFLANSSGNMQSGWADFYGGKKDGAANDSSLVDGDGVLAMTYAKFVARDATNQGIRIFQNTDGSWKTVYSNSTLSGSGTDNITSVAIGGLCTAHVSNNNTRQGDGATVAAGMKVYAVAVSYSPALTNGDASLTSLVWPSEANAEAKIGKTLFDTVEEAITAATTGENKTVSLNKDIAAGASIEIPEGVTLDIKGHDLNRAVTGSGTLIINKDINANTDTTVNLPTALTNSLKNNAWTGEVILVGGYNGVQMNSMQNLFNANSTLASKGNKGWLLQESLTNAKLKLVDNGSTPALYISRSSGGWTYKINKLIGDGTLKVNSSDNTLSAIRVTDGSEFCGNIDMSNLALYFGDSATTAQNGLIKINSGTTMKVYSGKTWHAGPGGIEVAGTIKGSGTLEGTVAFAENSTLDLTDGMLTATTAAANGAFTVKVENLETFLAGDKQIMTLTAGGNSIYAAAVTVTDGTDTAQETYVLKTTSTAAVLVVPGSHTWTGATDGALNNPANWGVEGEMFSGENQFVVFPADVEQKTVNVSNITLGKITINGAYTFTGNGTITLSELAFGEGGSLKLGTGTTIKLPGALDKSLLSKITFAGGNIAVKEVPHFTQSENLMVDPTAYTTQGGHLLISWTDFMTHGEFGYGLPMLNSTALNPGATRINHATATLGEIAWGDNGSKARLLGMYGKIYLEVRTAEQLARKPIRILPLGDSITEGYNKTGNCANYRTQLAAKLSMAGYMVETLGYHYVRSRMPSGEWAPVEWQYHAGVSAQRVWTQRPTSNGVEYNNRAGDMEALETTLNACGGTPDVVLVKLGTNDIGRGDDKDHIYQGLTNILTAVHKKFPDAKVITTTAVNYKSNPQIRKDYNALIRNAFATGGEFTKSEYNKWLYFVDQCKKVGNGTDDGSYNDMEGRRLFIDDDTHPDWAGHDLMSDGWYDKIVDIIKVGDGKDKPAKVACKLGAKANVPAEYLNGFVRYRQLDIAEEAAYPQEAFDSYTWKSEKTVTEITKVGYFMELVRKDSGEHTFVWVDMDNFGDDTVQSFGLPTTATTQKSVSKLHVYSNLGCIHKVEANDNTVSGYIEFSPYNATAGSVAGAPTKLWDSMDWNDTYATSGAGRGAMQIHRVKKVGDKLWNGAEVLFAYNNWGSANTGVAGTKAGEIGIGNFAQHYVGDHTANGNGQEINELYGSNTINIGGGEASNNVSVDYTATRFSPVGDKVNAKAYEVMRLEIWVKGTVSGDAAEEPVVITTIPEAGVEIKPDDDVKVTIPQDSTATAVAAKIFVKYTDANGTTTDLKTRGYVTVVVADNGAVTVAPTDDAKPAETKIKMALPKEGEGEGAKDKVSFTITDPIPGLFYSIVSANGPTDAHFEAQTAVDSDGVQATSSDPHTTSIDMPTDAKVKYFRVRVKATK